MKKRGIFFLGLCLFCILTACGERKTQRYVYEYNQYAFGVDIPENWTYKDMEVWEATTEEPLREASPEIGFEVYIEGDEERVIYVQRQYGKPQMDDFDCEGKFIQVKENMTGLVGERRFERDGKPYIFICYIIKDHYMIFTSLEEEVYRDHKKEIDAMVQSFFIVK